MTKTVRITMIAGVVFAMMLGATAMAQEQRGQRGQRGQFDPAQMQAMMMERIQEQLGATDEEWKVIQPLVANVMKNSGTRCKADSGAWVCASALADQGLQADRLPRRRTGRNGKDRTGASGEDSGAWRILM